MDRKNINLILLVLVLTVLNVIIASQFKGLAIITGLVSLYLVYFTYRYNKEVDLDHKKEIQTLDRYFDDITRNAIFSMPFPLTILDGDGKIIWYNSRFNSLFDETLKDQYVENFIPELRLDTMLEEEEGKFEVKIADKHYFFYYRMVDSYDQKSQDIILIYGIDRTEYFAFKDKYQMDKLIVMNLEVDNYDEIRSSSDERDRPLIFGEIDRIINSFAVDYQGFARKYENDKYLMIFDQDHYEAMKDEKFPLVDQLKGLEDQGYIAATMSAGVGAVDGTPLDIYKLARLALDIALGRGGDQIVENNGESLQYFGGKKGAVDKRNKVKSRIMANATCQLIDQMDDVYIMGHKNPDMDSFGACLGMYALAKSRKDEVHIVLKDVSPAISSLYEEVTESIEGIKDDIISPDQAISQADENSLIVLVDNHSRESAESSELIDLTDNLILIDHHRRGENYIESPTLTYLEPYASSASELVTELIQYAKDDVDLAKSITDGLLAGIKVDTKSFTFQTGVRTFEAASYLKKKGADSVNVNRLFDEPIDTIRTVAKLVSEAEIYRDKIAISVFDEDASNSVLIAAKTADQLLSIKGVKGSFVLTSYEGRIHISGRSTGAMSVQIILEKLGGGGHQTAAGVQLKDISFDQAIEKLKEKIDEYLEEDKK